MIFAFVVAVALSQVDGGAESIAWDAGGSSARAEDGGAAEDWTLPSQIPLVPAPARSPFIQQPFEEEEEPDAGTASPVVIEREPADRVHFDALFSLVADELVLSSGDGALISTIDLRLSRQFDRWFVGASMLTDAQTSRFELNDRGTHFWLRWKPLRDFSDGFTLRLFPLGLQRLRIGAAPLSFGSDLYTIQQLPGPFPVSTTPLPSVAAVLNGRWAGKFARGSVQTLRQLNLITGATDRVFAFSFGAGTRWNVLDVEADILHARRGFVNTITAPGAPSQVMLTAVRGRVGASSDTPIPPPVDFNWERRNSERHTAFFPDEEPTVGTDWAAHIEVIRFDQPMLRLPEETIDEEPVTAAALMASVRFDQLRIHFRGLIRPPKYFVVERAAESSFIFIPGIESQTERMGRLTVEWAFGDGLPRVGLGMGASLPAAVRSPTLTLGVPTTPLDPGGWRTVRDYDQMSSPTIGLTAPREIIDARATVSWQPHALGALAAEVKWESDPSRARPVSATNPALVAEDPNRFFISLIAQIRL